MKHTNLTRRALTLFACFFWVLLISSPAFAGNDTPMGNVFCTVIGWMSGNLGKGLETICITTLGIAALLGKISWNAAILDGIGAAVIFGAAQIVDAMGAGAPLGCATS